MPLRYAYNTNGLQSHRLEDAATLLADLGYDGIALTLDHMHLDPEQHGASEARAVARTLRRLLKPLAARYDHAFLDCPPSIALLAESVFAVADVCRPTP